MCVITQIIKVAITLVAKSITNTKSLSCAPALYLPSISHFAALKAKKKTNAKKPVTVNAVLM